MTTNRDNEPVQVLPNDQFASRIGVSPSYASYLRNGKRLPSLSIIIRIITAFELDPVTALRAAEGGAESFGKYLREDVFSKLPAPSSTAEGDVEPEPDTQ